MWIVVAVLQKNGLAHFDLRKEAQNILISVFLLLHYFLRYNRLYPGWHCSSFIQVLNPSKHVHRKVTQ